VKINTLPSCRFDQKLEKAASRAALKDSSPVSAGGPNGLKRNSSTKTAINMGSTVVIHPNKNGLMHLRCCSPDACQRIFGSKHFGNDFTILNFKTSWLGSGFSQHYWHASHVPPFIIASIEQAIFSASVAVFLVVAAMWPRCSFWTSMVAFSMFEACRVRR
jgi:hypothetical protein